MSEPFTYQLLKEGRDPYDGWQKAWLRRNDGLEIKVTKRRLKQLKREGRVHESEHQPGAQ